MSRSLFICSFFAISYVQGGPDLMLDELNMQASMYIATETYNQESCEINECLMHLKNGPFPITRKLLRFDTRAGNIGDEPFNLGNPFDQTNINFVYDPCHRHYHFEDFAEYKVFSVDDVDETTNLVPETGKRAFCLMDSAQLPSNLYSGVRRSTSRFNCDYQGISVGWQDIYGSQLDCQFVDVTDLPDGDYKLVVTLNPVGRLNEDDMTNNRAVLLFTIGNSVTLPGNANCNVPRPDWLGDGYCDRGPYNTPECNYDQGDCCIDCCRATGDYTCGVNGYQCLDPDCVILETPQMNELQCNVENIGWIGDGYCDRDGGYNTEQCDWDGGDCCRQTCVNNAYTCGEGGYSCLNPSINGNGNGN